ncbi:hypothetical protein PUNSTDRAFT_127628 [Punctularia strigosozonata HHB-11173 SS5]|uniref:uncharacterized protein n=1 Tax=Punctularia strigosozonata (strain HHB-11173) TaxID=741275 RepID=UPI0004417ED8|nr:uncharacterized protein PUNSTDRAFT_127628 [Punctularia strigosozonata HHB-11173 SS5]EIN06292.1 hypothetical protein PUNSTDRAFT_127628 [Punctularia strigosozonata HHB-11173 SS5]
MSTPLPRLTLKDTRTDDSPGHTQLFLVLYPWTAHKDRYCFLIIPNSHDQTSGTICYPSHPSSASTPDTGVKHDKFRAVATSAWVREELLPASNQPHQPGTLRRRILDIPVRGLRENRGAAWALSTLRALGSPSLAQHAADSLLARCVHDSGMHALLAAAWLEVLETTRVPADAEGTRGSGTRSTALEPQGRFVETPWSADELVWQDIEREPKRVRIASQVVGGDVEGAQNPPDSPASGVQRGRPPPMSRTISSGSSKLRKRSRSRTRG